MTGEEQALGMRRVARWPRADVQAAARLTNEEQRFLVEAAALLDIRPVDEGPVRRGVVSLMRTDPHGRDVKNARRHGSVKLR